MTHEEVRPLLADYAAGTLPDGVVEQVRGHLASGCLECLGVLYAHPVGLARPRRPLPVRRSWGVVAVVGLGAVAFGGWAWTAWRLNAERIQHAAERSKLAGLAEARIRLGDDVARLERERDDIRDRLAAAQASQGDSEAERARLEGALADATTRLETAETALSRRDRRLAAAAPLRHLLNAPGLELVPLAPTNGVRGARGHALWHPGAGALVVYAYDLPRLGANGAYRLRLVVNGHVLRPDIALTRQRSGLSVAAVRLKNGDPAYLAEVQVVRDPGEEPVLAGRMSPPAG